jgi:hypothetical protein
MQQKRFILALVISSAILFFWSYFYPVKPPQNPQSSTPQTATSQPTPAPAGSTASPTVNQSTSALVNPQSSAPQRTITIETPLYRVRFDSHGAEPVSWVISKNKVSGAEIFSVAGKKSDGKKLELISPEGLSRQPGRCLYRFAPAMLYLMQP